MLCGRNSEYREVIEVKNGGRFHMALDNRCFMPDSGEGVPPLGLTFMAFLSVFFTAASTYIYNDYIDTEMDQLNNVKKNRPMVTGEVSMEFARWFIAITAVAGLGYHS